jgi:hypothetical protein
LFSKKNVKNLKSFKSMERRTLVIKLKAKNDQLLQKLVPFIIQLHYVLALIKSKYSRNPIALLKRNTSYQKFYKFNPEVMLLHYEIVSFFLFKMNKMFGSILIFYPNM